MIIKKVDLFPLKITALKIILIINKLKKILLMRKLHLMIKIINKIVG